MSEGFAVSPHDRPDRYPRYRADFIEPLEWAISEAWRLLLADPVSRREIQEGFEDDITRRLAGTMASMRRASERTKCPFNDVIFEAPLPWPRIPAVNTAPEDLEKNPLVKRIRRKKLDTLSVPDLAFRQRRGPRVDAINIIEAKGEQVIDYDQDAYFIEAKITTESVRFDIYLSDLGIQRFVKARFAPLLQNAAMIAYDWTGWNIRKRFEKVLQPKPRWERLGGYSHRGEEAKPGSVPIYVTVHNRSRSADQTPLDLIIIRHQWLSAI